MVDFSKLSQTLPHLIRVLEAQFTRIAGRQFDVGMGPCYAKDHLRSEAGMILVIRISLRVRSFTAVLFDNVPIFDLHFLDPTRRLLLFRFR